MVQNVNNLITYFSNLPPDHLKNLYKHPSTFRLILKTIPKEICKSIFDLLYCDLPLKLLQNSKERSNFKVLKDLKFIEKSNDKIKLVDQIKDSIMELLNNVNEDGRFVVCTCSFLNNFELNNENLIPLNFYAESDYYYRKIENKRVNRLEEILHNIVNPIKFNSFIKKILRKTNILNENLAVTHKGFEFLLKSKKEQFWMLLLEGINLLSPTEQVEHMIFLGDLVKLQVNVLYENKNPILNFFKDLGVLEFFNEDFGVSETFNQDFRSKSKDSNLLGNHFYLSESFEYLFMTNVPSTKKFLIVETNHKIYAYTVTDYEKSILTQFCEIQYSLPSITVGILSLNNINCAFDRGITAQQIVDYLNTYSNYVPLAISELIFVYEKQKKRIKIFEGFMYKNFLNITDFDKTVVFCERNNFLINKDIKSRIVVVKTEAHEAVKEFVKKNIL